MEYLQGRDDEHFLVGFNRYHLADILRLMRDNFFGALFACFFKQRRGIEVSPKTTESLPQLGQFVCS